MYFSNHCSTFLYNIFCYKHYFKICDIIIMQFAYLASTRLTNKYMFIYITIDMKM